MLESILTQCNVVLDSGQLDLLWRYHKMLREANPRLNLTRIHNFESMVLKHYADSLLVLKHIELPSPLVDMGSGPDCRAFRSKSPGPRSRWCWPSPAAHGLSFSAMSV